MITRTAYQDAQTRAAQLLRQTGVALREDELSSIAVADFGLGELAQTGAQILTLLDTPEIAVKLIALFPDQTLPEHRHPPLGDYPGKAETLRCEMGAVYLYAAGEPSGDPLAHPPDHRRATYTVWREVALCPGDQVTLPPDTLHWFQAGPDGAVVWSYSSRAVDVQDVFTDPDIRRETVVVEEAEKRVGEEGISEYRIGESIGRRVSGVVSGRLAQTSLASSFADSLIRWRTDRR